MASQLSPWPEKFANPPHQIYAKLEPMKDVQILEGLIDQCETAISTGGGRTGLADWIVHNTRDPRNPAKPWSFAHHEFQIGILEDQAPHIVVRKAAQKGVSEIFVRAALGLAAKLSGEHLIYVLPTTRFAQKFASSRIDPVVTPSERLRRIISTTIDSSELKKIGNCFLHIGGAQKESQAISIPAKALVRDEFSFGDPNVLATYQSRLEHNMPGTEIIYDFSTPLFPEMGIDEPYLDGTQYVYMCYHEKCGHWVVVDSLEHIVLPGWDDLLEKLTRTDLSDPKVKVQEAWVRCENCHSPISQENLANPQLRAWVAHYPNRDVHSYHVDPLCTPAITTASKVIASLKLYRKTSKWVQYGCGKPYEAADSTILKKRAEEAFTIQPIAPSKKVSVYGAVAGMDVGNVSYLCHGRKNGRVLEIFNMEMVRQDGDNNLGVTFTDRYSKYHAIQGVIDSGPDISVVKYAQANLPYNQVWGGYFVRSSHSASLDLFEADEKSGLLKIRRTMAIDDFVTEFNSRRILLPRGLPFEEAVKSHLSKPKRLVAEDALGEEAAIWVSKGEDHWFFALLYCWLASKRVEDGAVVPMALGTQRLVTKARVGSSR